MGKKSGLLCVVIHSDIQCIFVSVWESKWLYVTETIKFTFFTSIRSGYHSYSANIPSVNQSLPYIWEHVYMYQIKCSADSLFQIRNMFRKRRTLNLIVTEKKNPLIAITSFVFLRSCFVQLNNFVNLSESSLYGFNLFTSSSHVCGLLFFSCF